MKTMPGYESTAQAVVLHCFQCEYRSPVITRSLAVMTKPAVCSKEQCGLTISPADSMSVGMDNVRRRKIVTQEEVLADDEERGW